MKVVLFILVLCAVSVNVFAHEHRTYEIGNLTFEFTVGNLNEPVFVNDKSGVDFKAMVNDGKEKKPAIDLESSLKVQVLAEGKTQTFDLKPAWNSPGAYKAEFFPTAATMYSYRIFGTINNVPIDITFHCNHEGHVMHGTQEHSEEKISENVKLISKGGTFGCPQSKENVNFPPLPTNTVPQELVTYKRQSTLALIFAIIGVLLGGINLWKKRK